MEKKRIFITTPVFYPNDKPHFGHAYTLVVSDVFSRFFFSYGYEVHFQTGLDENGEKVFQASEKSQLSFEQFIQDKTKSFEQLFRRLNINNLFFYHTSDLKHKQKVSFYFQKLLNQGDIYFGDYQGNYCLSCEEFIPKKNNFCPSCLKVTKEISEPAFFFRIAKYVPWLKETFTKKTDFIIPKKTILEMLNNFLDEDQRDLCITRQRKLKKEEEIGISVPNYPNLMIYVWFDALLNYLSSPVGEINFNEQSSQIIHLIGKDISRFHCIYWPIILYRCQKRLPDKIIAHGWLLNKGKKMGKSLSNALDPLDFLKKNPREDVIRVYLIARIKFLEDGLISEELLDDFFKSFFVNQLGNLVFRVLSMIEKYNQGVIPEYNENLARQNNLLFNYESLKQKTKKDFEESMENWKPSEAFSSLEELIRKSNQIINLFSPWKIFSADEELVLVFLNSLSRGIILISFLLSFFAPKTSEEIFFCLNVLIDEVTWDNCLKLDLLKNKEVINRKII